MKKLIVLVCSLLLLSACAVPSEQNMPHTNETESPSPSSLPETSEPPPVTDESWVEAYINAMFDVVDGEHRAFTLADVTGDGIPELFFADFGTGGRWINDGFSCSNGTITNIVIPDGFMQSELELYRDKDTGGLIWIAGDTHKNGYGEYIHEWYIADFNDVTSVKQELLFGWSERLNDNGIGWQYLLYGNDGTGSYENSVKSALEQLLERQEQFFSSYELVEAAGSFESVISFMIDYDPADPIKLTEDNLNRPLLTMYLSNWGSRTTADKPKNRVPITEYPEPSAEPWKEAYIDVLHDAIPYYSTDIKDNIVISRMVETVTSDNGVTASVDVFTVIDLDSDGIPEVLLSILLNENNNVGYEILHYQDGAVYGYTIWSRVMVDLKTDATFTQSGGAADYGFGTMRFAEETWAVDRFAECASFWDRDADKQIDEYYINGVSVTAKEFQSIAKKQNAKENVTWYDFTEVNIAALLN